ncbi:ubiquinol-cytochrome-c reductase complex assembly factor 1 isoform X2 [Nasonia vitripennis]|nr:ubiquinol-cytochrome-c reductase complex assembly factor 1 isoform X2 [Nasonia vitripennis]XP_032458009.1 ubiquinol-cytochrome-c reductase complex assembly factor 1 isoform X2 [Nasonia vitripennis]XP_032458010.1 ubiquinol-cytochrome-c reductase complex assembly factor 1 isoform X2 [Nasonia vitripennis]XP_032458011.1 ubiquinol-cytochrome-c reductase complex assembly factor 1 isoform X2 [Nasonia vitripennis]XP_032458012.1 ubiquinol-cytochrome-c reductase complex assembly factor 1 isoform X2 [N
MESMNRKMFYLSPILRFLLIRNQSFYKPLNHFNSTGVIPISSKKFYSNFTNISKWFEKPSKKYKLGFSGAVLYENVADKLDYNFFFNEFKMDDTLFSWFLVTELHVWILMLRTMQEGEDGQRLRNYIVEAMWNDVNVRAKKLANMKSSLFKKQIELLSEQFNASIIGYDEAVLSSDLHLAGHLWRRFFKCENIDPENLEKLVYYIRHQVNSLGSTSSTVIFSASPNIQWKYV